LSARGAESSTTACKKPFATLAALPKLRVPDFGIWKSGNQETEMPVPAFLSSKLKCRQFKIA
jgi:hypothetical protein